jgi:hypothetical protein
MIFFHRTEDTYYVWIWFTQTQNDVHRKCSMLNNLDKKMQDPRKARKQLTK